MGAPINANGNHHITRWAKTDPAERARCVVSVVEKLREEQRPRHTAAARNYRTYLGRSVASLGGYLGPVIGGDTSDTLTFRIAQAVVDAAKAKIASKQRPKPIVVTNGGNYTQRMRARKKSKFLEAQLRRRHGRYNNAWELTEQVFKDSSIWEAGVLKVVADTVHARPVIERCFCYDIYFDPHEAVHGSPQNLFHRYGYDRLNLAERFPQHRTEIMRATPYEHEHNVSAATKTQDQVCIYESWRLPYGPDAPGRHVIAISTSAQGSSALALVDEEWSRDNFPFVFCVWETHAHGVWGNPLVEQIEATQQATNDTFEFINEKVQTNSTTIIAYDPNVYDEADLQANDGVVTVPMKGDGQPLQVHQAAPFHPGMFQWGQYLHSSNFELTGVSEMGATGKNELGAGASGRALRTMNALNVERFLPKSRAYENMFPEIGKLMLWAMEDLAAMDEVDQAQLKAQLVAGDSVEDFAWEDVALDDYEVTMQPASSLPDTPAARLELVNEFAAAGWISPDAAKRLLSQDNPDIEAANQREHANHRYIERLIGDIQSWDPDSDEPPQIDPPDPLLDLEASVIQLTLAYREMKGESAPEEMLRLARNWITEAIEAIQKKQAEAQAMAPPQPGAGPMPGGDPGMMPEMPPEAAMMPPEAMPPMPPQ